MMANSEKSPLEANVVSLTSTVPRLLNRTAHARRHATNVIVIVIGLLGVDVQFSRAQKKICSEVKLKGF